MLIIAHIQLDSYITDSPVSAKRESLGMEDGMKIEVISSGKPKIQCQAHCK